MKKDRRKTEEKPENKSKKRLWAFLHGLLDLHGESF